MADIDNAHSDEPADWIKPEMVLAAFPGVAMYQYPSRNNMKPKVDEKTGAVKTPRPKFHNIIPIEPTANIDEYTAIMKQTTQAFPELHFDIEVKSGGAAQFWRRGCGGYLYPRRYKFVGVFAGKRRHASIQRGYRYYQQRGRRTAEVPQNP
jgi:hypothetical protein